MATAHSRSLAPLSRALIPAAGLGTRLLPATRVQAKEMLPLGAKPVIQFVAEELLAAGLHQALVITCAGKDALGDHFDLRAGYTPTDPGWSASGVFDPRQFQVFYTRQQEPRGLGDAVLHGEAFVNGEDFVVALGDAVILGPGEPSLLQRLLAVHREHAAVATLAVRMVPPEAASRYGMVDIAEATDGVFRLRGIVEKPGPAAAPSPWAVTARYVFSPALFDYLRALPPGLGGELQLTDALAALIAAGLPVFAVPLAEKEIRLDVGNLSSYGRAFLRTVLSDPQVGADLQEYAAHLLAYLRGETTADPDRWTG